MYTIILCHSDFVKNDLLFNNIKGIHAVSFKVSIVSENRFLLRSSSLIVACLNNPLVFCSVTVSNNYCVNASRHT